MIVRKMVRRRRATPTRRGRDTLGRGRCTPLVSSRQSKFRREGSNCRCSDCRGRRPTPAYRAQFLQRPAVGRPRPLNHRRQEPVRATSAAAAGGLSVGLQGSINASIQGIVRRPASYAVPSPNISRILDLKPQEGQGGRGTSSECL